MMRQTALVFSFVCAFAVSGPASADNLNAALAGGQSYDASAPDGDWHVTVGAGALVVPEYQGGEEYEFIPVPYIDIRYRDRVELNPFDGLRFNALQNEALTLGVGLGADFGRDDDDADRLRGLGDVDPAAEGLLFAEYRYERASLGVTFAHDMTGNGHEGYTAELEAAYMMPVNRRLFVTTSVGTHYASENYMDSYFGVNARQAARSGLQQFDAGAGFKDVSGGLFARYMWDESWSLNGFARYSRLVGDAADSPVIETENQAITGAFVAYSF